MSHFPRELEVSISGTPCGLLHEDSHGALSFEYLPAYRGVPLSLSMPIGLAKYNDRVVRPYLMGLLPDSETTRESIAAAYEISGDNPFRLLGVIGLDCPGAVQIFDPDDTQPFARDDELVPISDAEIAARLSDIRQDAAAAWTGKPSTEGHWSLGGCQAKITLRQKEGQWFECPGASATTHILKPGVEGMGHQALVEYLSMRIADTIGLPVAHVTYRFFRDEPAIIIERYDRQVSVDGTVTRIHQEDLCQALSVSPARKYADQRGPTTPKIIDLLKRTGVNAADNVYRFVLYLFFNYLIGATDAHAKNHSLLFESAQNIVLAPLYDVASIAPYRSLTPSKRKPLRAALSIGGENRFGMLSAEHVAKMVRDCGLEALGLDDDLLMGRLRMMAQLIPSATDKVIEEAKVLDSAGIESVGSRMSREIRANCSRTLELL